MPAWIHDRAKHLQEKNPDMSESQAWAIATQQAYAAGKAPKSYGTEEGRREAKKKYDEPKKEYVQTADPKSKTASSSSHTASTSTNLTMWEAFEDELQKIAANIATPKFENPGEPTAMTKVKKTVYNQKSALSTRRPNYTQVHSEPQTAPPVDPLSSSKTAEPPPVTAPGA